MAGRHHCWCRLWHDMFRQVVAHIAALLSIKSYQLTANTLTGVAWSMGPEWPDPRTIQHWPGKLGHELRNKVESSVSYDVHTGHLTTWGFLCNPEDERFEYNALFKLNLDPDYKDPIEGAPSNQEARGWYQDYLGGLYRYVMQYFHDTVARFQSKRIESVLFSNAQVPVKDR